MKVKLNKVQQKAVDQTQGPVLVLAGAGSGKTRVLTHRVAKLIDDGVSASNILALTFTNKAANEMKQRIYALVGAKANDIWIGTFHAICLKILIYNIEKIGYKSGFVIYDADDSLAVIKRIFKASPYALTKDFNAKTIKYNISGAKNDGYDYKNYLSQYSDFDPKAYEHEATSYMFERYENALKQNNALDFDDLLIKTIELFEVSKETLSFYQRKFTYLLVDEYQDTNEVQYRLVKMLASHSKNIFAVGDDDQSIYGWRGANIQNIYDFEKDFKNTVTFKLEQNYRSHQKILDLSNAVIKVNEGRKDKVLYSETKAGAKPDLYVFSDEYAESRGIAKICKDLEQKDENLNDIAIIYRTNAQSRLIEQALVEANIPSKNLSGRSFYERREIKDLLAYLNLLVNKDADLFLTRVINTPKRKIGATSISKLAAYGQANELSLYDALEFAGEVVTKAAALSIKKFKAMMDDFILKKDSYTLDQLVDYVFIESGLKDMYRQSETMAESQARIENVEELIKNAAERELQGETIEDFLYNISLVTNMEREQNAQAVSLMTMHSAKGLEYRNVVIAGVVNGILPHTFSSYSKEGMEEERRLLYVGITRAMNRLYMTSFTSRATRANGYYETTMASISSFLTEVSQDLFDKQESLQAKQMMESIGIGKSQSVSPFSGFSKPSFMSGAVNKKQVSNSDVSYEKGCNISHPKFGVGQVKEINGSGDSLILSVKFENGDVKKIFAAIAPIEKL
jgi:DNA helicase II / ATP-dependent DNA helicase PcrA